MQKHLFVSAANLPDLMSCMAKPSHGHEPEKVLLVKRWYKELCEQCAGKGAHKC